MKRQTRRQFLTHVGEGVLIAGAGTAAALNLQPAFAWAVETQDKLDFGLREPLVRLMQDTPANRLLPLLAKRLKDGTKLSELVAAAALANARTFGGQDYIGFHTMMALAPALYMARELPKARQALPVFKVLYRNTHRIQQHGGRASEILHRVKPTDQPSESVNGRVLLSKIRNKQMDAAEATFAAIAQGSVEETFNELLIAVQDKSEVHRVVLAFRAWALLDVVGRDHAHTMLRQSVRYCVRSESPKYDRQNKGGRELLPKLLDQYKLLSKPLGKKPVEDKWIERMSETLFSSAPGRAADAVAAALAEGISPNAVGEAMSLAANQLVLRDAGRRKSQARPGKPVGSVHGDSIGVHACDSANAWRNLSKIGNTRNTIACLILGAHQVAFDRTSRGGDFLNWQPYPSAKHLDKIKKTSPKELLRETETAIRENDQARACAAIARYSELEQPARPVFDLLRRFAISEDGALHAEKYFRTVTEEFAATRAAFRWRQRGSPGLR